MGRARRKSRRNRSHLQNNDYSGPRNNLDSDDDYVMHGVERNNAPSSDARRGRGGYHNNTNNNNRHSNGQNRGGRLSNNRHPSDKFVSNPFASLGWGGSTYDEQQGPRFHQRNRSEQGRDGQRRLNNYRGRGRGGPSIAPTPNNEDHNGRVHNQGSPRGGGGGEDVFPPLSPAAWSSPPPRSPSPPASAGGGRGRFCTECSAVRRANLTLRDWLSSGIARASEVLDSWGDEVGVSRGSGDEMDWQPEPVVRVLIVPTTGPPATPSHCGAGAGWQQESCNDGGLGGGGVAVNYMMTGSSPLGLRPGTISPEFSGGDGGGAWGNGGGGGGGGGGMFAPGNTSVLGQGCVGQTMNNCASSWAYNNAAFRPQHGKMITPPNTPPSLTT
ncbi:hypothetical protein F4824DRAFT_504593 [Ustulina deusta]|nr:hypothetical protein F4824DRAFT_504593 [Ustulina deusta]